MVARVNDRGPTTPGRIADLSTAAARRIGMLRAGIVQAKPEVMSAPLAKAKTAKTAKSAKKACSAGTPSGNRGLCRC